MKRLNLERLPRPYPVKDAAEIVILYRHATLQSISRAYDWHKLTVHFLTNRRVLLFRRVLRPAADRAGDFGDGTGDAIPESESAR